MILNKINKSGNKYIDCACKQHLIWENEGEIPFLLQDANRKLIYTNVQKILIEKSEI